jgi:hypothetical protein
LSKSKAFKLSGISLPYPPPSIHILCVSSDVQVRGCVGPVPLVEAEPLAKGTVPVVASAGPVELKNLVIK